MSDEIQEIERLIKQIGELDESLVHLVRKLQAQNAQRPMAYQNDTSNLAALEKKGSGEPSHSDGRQGDYNSDSSKRHQAVLDAKMIPHEAALELLFAAVADKAMTSERAASEIAKLLRPDLPVSRRIAIREDVKKAFEIGDDFANRIQPFLKNTIQQAEQRKMVQERRSASAGMNPI